MERKKALAYLRTSSATNVDGDSKERQKKAIWSYAAREGIELVDEFYDPAVSGADPVDERPGFSAMLDRIEDNGVRLVLVEDASRFARSMLAQELGVLVMQQRGVTVVTTSGEDLTNTDDPARVMMRQVAGAFAQYEKTRLVHKLRAARDRKSQAMGRRIEGSKPKIVGEALAMMRRMHRKNPRTGERKSLRRIAALMAAAGHFNPRSGKPYSAEAIRLALSTKRRPS
jgi:DNA invertase Pin-like site-specific DNA recombinase